MKTIIGMLIGIIIAENIQHFLNAHFDDWAIKPILFFIVFMILISWEKRITNRSFNFTIRPFFRFLIGCVGATTFILMFLKHNNFTFKDNYSEYLFLMFVGMMCFLFAFIKNVRTNHFSFFLLVVSFINTIICSFFLKVLNFSQIVLFVVCLVYIIYFVIRFWGRTLDNILNGQ